MADAHGGQHAGRSVAIVSDKKIELGLVKSLPLSRSRVNAEGFSQASRPTGQFSQIAPAIRLRPRPRAISSIPISGSRHEPKRNLALHPATGDVQTK